MMFAHSVLLINVFLLRCSFVSLARRDASSQKKCSIEPKVWADSRVNTYGNAFGKLPRCNWQFGVLNALGAILTLAVHFVYIFDASRFAAKNDLHRQWASAVSTDQWKIWMARSAMRAASEWRILIGRSMCLMHMTPHNHFWLLQLADNTHKYPLHLNAI